MYYTVLKRLRNLQINQEFLHRVLPLPWKKLAQGAASQAMNIANASDYMNKLYDGIKEVEGKTAVVSNIAKNTRMLSEKALGTVENLKTSLQKPVKYQSK